MSGAGYAENGVQTEAFQRGDMAALGEAVDRCLPWVWRLVGRGFLASIDGVPVYVRGLTDPDHQAHEVERIVAECLQPGSRSRIDSRRRWTVRSWRSFEPAWSGTQSARAT